MLDATPRQVRSLVIGVVALLLLTLVATLTSLGMRGRSDELSLRHRLRRCGMATVMYVVDSGWQSFPPIVNPPQGQLWEPDRPGSAQVILREYLQGSLRPRQGSKESEAAWVTRLREAEMTVDPATGLPLWYNEDLARTPPDAVARGRYGEVNIFTTQRDPDGTWPWRQGGRSGIWAVQASGKSMQVHEDEIATLAEDLRQLAAENPDDPRLPALRLDLTRLQDAMRSGGEQTPEGRVFISAAIETPVQFIPMD